MALLLASSPVLADDDDQEVAREALSKGLIRPLSELLEKIESMYSGHILEVELESEDDYNDEDGEILIYEIKFLTLQGNVVKLKFDAKNLELLVTDGWDLDKAKKKYEDDD
ncbi:MAG: peptidase [Rhodospirillaceae bacterium]|nr:peptidase [Rhodospirillaceae bacterium]